MNDYNCTCVPGFLGKNCSNSKSLKIKSVTRIEIFLINSEQWMVIAFQVYRCTTWLALFKKVVLHKLHIQVSLPLLKLTREIRLYKEKRNLIHIYAIAIFNLSKISFRRISSVECPCGINLNAFNWCDKLVLYNYMFLVDMDILLSLILTMLFFFLQTLMTVIQTRV